MYDKYFHSPAITRALKNNTFGDKPTFDNYMNRIINFTNEHSDLNALPELKNIYRTIFSQVKTMTTMSQAFSVAVDVLNKVYNNMDPLPANSDMEQVGQGDGNGQGQGGEGG